MNEINIKGKLDYDQLKAGGLPELSHWSIAYRHPFEIAEVGIVEGQCLGNRRVVYTIGIAKATDLEKRNHFFLVSGTERRKEGGWVMSGAVELKSLEDYRTLERFTTSKKKGEKGSKK